MVDELVKSRQIPFSVIPADAGIQSYGAVQNPGVHRVDNSTLNSAICAVRGFF
jgi:hypothetical protein